MEKFGLVLGGGGSKGAYEVGVWKALREMGIPVSVVTGTSIGALNGALVAQDDYDAALELWNSIKYESVLGSVSSDSFTTAQGTVQAFQTVLKEIVQDGGMDIAPLEDIVRRMVNEEKIRSSNVELGIVTVEFPSLKTVLLSKEQVPEGEMADYLLASAAVYPAFKRREIGGTRYIDGGYKNNLPIDFAARLGADEILAVDLDSFGLIPRRMALRVPVKILHSYWSLGNFLVFEQEQIQKDLTLGYYDTMKLYQKLEGFAYTFEVGETERYLKEQMPAYRSLQAKLGLDSAGKRNLNPTEKLMHIRITQLLQDAQRVGRKPVSPQLRIAELAAETVGVSPLERYTVEAFNAAIRERYEQRETFDMSAIEGVFKNPASLPRVTEQIAGMERIQVLSFVYGWIDDVATGKNKNRNLVLLGAVAPRELVSALYIYTLSNN